jgi:DNA recombination protein RmuC
LPVKQSLEKFEQRVGEVEKSRIGAYESLTAQVKSMLATQGEFEQSTPCLAELAAALGLLDRALETFTQTVQ